MPDCMGEPYRIKYYNNVLFHNVQKDFLIQTGDPTGTGKGGDSVFKYARAASRIFRLYRSTFPSSPRGRHAQCAGACKT